MTVVYHCVEGVITTLLAKQYNREFTLGMGITNAFLCSFYRVATLGMRLCVLHNLYFYNTMMEEIRDALDAGNFASYKEEKLYGMGQINREKEMEK